MRPPIRTPSTCQGLSANATSGRTMVDTAYPVKTKGVQTCATIRDEAGEVLEDVGDKLRGPFDEPDERIGCTKRGE